MGRNVYKENVNLVRLPEPAQREDRGLELCAKPFLVLADTSDSTYWKNDRTGVAFRVDSLTVELEGENGNVEAAPGLAIDFPYQSDAKGFVVDWRQYVDGGSLKVGCYKLKISYTKDGISGSFYYGSYKLMPYSVGTSEGTVRVWTVLDDYVRKDGINYKDSGFANTIRFEGKFGYMKPGVESENLIKVNRVREKIRNEALRVYELTSDYLLSCFTERIDNEHLLAASIIYISDYNKDNHVEYKDLPVILDPEQTYDIEYSRGTPYASVKGYFLDKRAYYESKYDGNIPASENVILDLPTGSSGCADAEIDINGTNYFSVASGDTLDIIPKDSNGDTLTVSGVSGNEVSFDITPETQDLTILIPYSSGDDQSEITIVANSAGNINSTDTTGLSNVIISKNSSSVSTPFSIGVGDIITIDYDAAGFDGVIELIGSYV